ncbi:DNA ligase, partial [Phytophthora megakarya]
YTAAIGLVAKDKGISLRFPRFIRIRDDKETTQATNASQIADLYRAQGLTTVANDRSFGCRAGNSPMRRASELNGRRRHDQQRLLVELELDDSLYQGAIRAGMEQTALRNPDDASGRRSSRSRFVQPYDQEFNGEVKLRLQSRARRDSAAKPLTERQMQQHRVKRLSSPYKLKQQVLDTRNDPISQRYRQKSPHDAGILTQRVRSPTLQPSPTQLVIESIRQNIHLRDQVMAHLQQELMGVLPLHRASHVEKNVPQRVVKLLNRLRSLSLAVVETVVYLSCELGDLKMFSADVEHDILEQDFYRYLLQMASSDTDFLACSPPLKRFFEDFEVNLTRNPLVDGLSLDSSEVLLCSCHQSASSGSLFCSASSSSSSLLRLLTQKLESFAFQTQRYLPGWQILPAGRVAAALLHLVDLETRFNAVRMLPKYLQSHDDNMNIFEHRRADGYGTFEGDERIHRLDRHSYIEPRLKNDLPRGKVSPTEAWVSSPTAKTSVPSESRPSSSTGLNTVFYHPLPSPKLSSESLPSAPKTEEGSAIKLSSTWVQVPSPADPTFTRTSLSLKSDVASSPVFAMSSKLSADVAPAENKGDANVKSTPMAPPVLDSVAIPKASSRRSSCDQSEFQKKAKNTKEQAFHDGVQANQPSARTISSQSLQNDVIQMSDYESTATESALRQSLTNDDQTEMDNTIGSTCDMESLEMHELIESTSYDYLIPPHATDSETLPPLVLSRDTINKESDESITVMGNQPAEDPIGSVNEIGVNNEDETEDIDEFTCNFGYSSNEALASIAMALQMLPNLSLSNVESPLDDEVLTPEDARPPIEFEAIERSRMSEHETVASGSDGVSADSLSMGRVYSAPAHVTTQYRAGVLSERVVQKPEMSPSEEDEFAYSSATAVSNIAMALSLLPSVSRDDIFSVPIIEVEHEFGTPRRNTYRSAEEERSRHEHLEIMNVFELPIENFSDTNFTGVTNDDALYSIPASSSNYDRMMVSGALENNLFPIQSHANNSETTTSRINNEPIGNTEVECSKPASSRSNISAAKSVEESEPSQFNRIFALCRDIQVAAFDMSHWVSQREIEDHIQSVAQPFSALVGYSSPVPAIANVDDTPKYLERELKMLRRNFASWKVAVIGQKRAKLVVRRLIARRKVRQFVLHHHCRFQKARIEEENRLRFLAASRIQRNWSIYCHNEVVAKRKAVFRVLQMAFHRTLFFVGISQRRRHRENAKEKMVQWWRHQRVRIKKKLQRQENLVRDRKRRARALRDIQKFLKEIILRRRLEAAQEVTKNILFKQQLKWTKAKRDVEKTMNLNSKHRRELIEDMNARFVDLDRKWQVAENERLQLLTHHERVVQQQQQAVEVRRRRLAALKIQMFFRVCLLHKKLQKVEMEKEAYEVKLRKELLTKEKREVDTQRHVIKTRTQVRVLERKINRMAQEALQTDGRHREIVQAHQQRVLNSQQHASRQKIKAFIDSRMLCRRADSERHRLLLEQARLQFEKTETELMFSEDQRERHQRASLIESSLKQRLSEVEARSEALLLAKNQLATEKELEAQRAAEALEHSKIRASMQQIASWVSEQVQLSKLKKEKAAISASAAREMMDVRQKQRREIDAKIREVASIKASSYMHQRISQHRNHKTVEAIRIQQNQKSAQQKAIAMRTRAQLVQIIIDVKLLTEREASKGIIEGLVGVAQFYKTHMYKFSRLKYLRSMNCARKIQRAWRRWTHEQSIKRAEELAFAQLLETKRRQVLAREIQIWWRRFVKEQLRRRKQQFVFDEHVKAIKIRASARKIQGVWKRWTQCQRERRCEQQRIFDAQLELIRARANVRKIQGAWKRWVLREQERRYQQQLAFDAQINAIRIRAKVRKIQRAWRRWITSEQDRRCQQQLAFERRLEAIRGNASARKIQCVWRIWIKSKRELKERRRAHRLVFSSVQRIQRWWRVWQQRQRVKATRDRIMRNACAQVIQRKWKQWYRWRVARRERQRLRIQQNACARRVQTLWRRWKCRRVENAMKIAEQKRIEAERKHEAQMIAEKSNQENQEQEERSVALKIQKNWAGKLSRRNKHEVERKRCLGAQRIQRKWRRWHRHKQSAQSRKRLKEDQRISATLLQRAWRKWHMDQLDRESQAHVNQEQEQMTATTMVDEDVQLEQEYVANVLKIQTFWRNEQKQRDQKREMDRVNQTRNSSSLTIQRNWGIIQHRRKMERKRIQHQQHIAALRIQTLWLKWHNELQEEIERERIRQEEDESSMKIQQNWVISHQRRKLSQERIRHKQNLNALKIQKHWRRWRHLRLEQQTQNNDGQSPVQRISLTKEPSPSLVQRGHGDEKLQQKLDVITYRSHGRRIARAVRKYLQNRREASAATKIEAIWKGKLYRSYYLQALEEKHSEEVRQYQLMISVLATKVQVCWRQWNIGVRQLKRAAVKSEELRLIEEAKALERKLRRAKRELAAKRIQRALASRRALIATKGVSHRDITEKAKVAEQEAPNTKDDQGPIDQPQFEACADDNQGLVEIQGDQLEHIQDPIEISKQDLLHATVELTVEDWSHRQLPHILSRSVNQILFCHEAVNVLQKCFREYKRRQRMHFYFQRSLVTTSRGESGELEKRVNVEHFHFYFVKARAWLDWDISRSTRSDSLVPDTNAIKSLIRLRFDLQMTRKLLQLLEPTEEYLASEIQQVLHEITADAFPILLSRVCLEDNDNPRPELRYHDAGEMDLPLSVKLLRQMGQHRAQIRRQQMLEVDTSFESLTVSTPVAKSVPSSPIERSAPSSPSQRTKKGMTMFTAVENASVDDAKFLQQRGVDLGALDPKTQRNALHMLSFSKENFRSRADMLEFLLSCGANLNVNGADYNGDTPLMLYASLGHLDFMQKLLEHGAEIQKTNNGGQNVLHRACEEDQVEICGFLQQLMLRDSIAENIIPADTIAKLLPTGLVLHAPDCEGRYPLHLLAEKGFVECAKQLVVFTELNYEWNLTLQAQGDPQGRTALHLAVQSHDIAMTAFLLTPGGGSNVNCFDDLHRSPLHYAVESPAALPIISRLIQHGASVNVADERGDTPLHWAAFSGRAAVAQNLLALGADPTLTNSDWETPAQIAAAYGQLDCMRLLLQAQRRRHGAAPAIEVKDHQQQPLIRPASEKTALERLEEAVNELHQKQASYRVADSNRGADQAQAGYWEELHQDVQLVEESGQFSSEDEDDVQFDMNF